MMPALKSILDIKMRCNLCGKESRVGYMEPSPSGGSTLVCPTPDCGGTPYLTNAEMDSWPSTHWVEGDALV